MDDARDDIETRFPLRTLTPEDARRAASLHRMEDFTVYAGTDPLSPEFHEVPRAHQELRTHRRRQST